MSIIEFFSAIDNHPLTVFLIWGIVLLKDVIIMEITIGMKGTAESFVEREDTAKEVGSGSLLVYATPCMVALMEGNCRCHEGYGNHRRHHAEH